MLVSRVLNSKCALKHTWGNDLLKYVLISYTIFLWMKAFFLFTVEEKTGLEEERVNFEKG